MIQDINVPAGCARITYPAATFSGYLQNLSLKSNNEIKTFGGDVLNSSSYNILGVIDMPLLFSSDIEQCADFCMRLWAEYHKSSNQLPKFFLFDYSGNKKFYSKSGKTFKEFLRIAFSNTNSYSLKKGCTRVLASELKPGDMFIQNSNGGIGHVSMIVDACVDSSGKKYFLIGYSFMPAQEFHIEKAEEKFGKGGWFTAEGYISYLKENLDFGDPVLGRF